MKTLNYVGRSVEEILKRFQAEYDAREGEFEANILDKGAHGIFGLFARDAVVEITLTNRYFERKLREFLEGVFKSFTSQFYVEVTSRGKTFLASCHSDDIGKVIGKHGKGLSALQHIAGIYLNRMTETKVSVIIDAGNYRERRREQLQRIVQMAVERARKYGKVKLDPMFAFERKMVHEIAKKFGDVRTYSEGLEPYRYVVIERKGGNRREDRKNFRNAATGN